MRIPSFFKKKTPEKKESIPYYDIHNHCLFALDDGPGTIESSMRILEGLFALGFRGVIATPHINHPQFPSSATDESKRRLDSLMSLNRTSIPEVIAAGEIYVHDNFQEVMKNGGFPGVSNAFLIEFGNHPGAIGPRIEEGLFFMLSHGHTPILAHVERYTAFQEHPELLERCRSRGAILQLDLMSLDGRFGERTRVFSRHLLDRGLIDIVATDIHSPEDLPSIARGISALSSLGSDEVARLLSVNPGAIFNGRPEDVVSR